MALLNGTDVGSNIANALAGGATSLDRAITAQNTQDFSRDGFTAAPIPGADGSGLPSSKVRSGRIASGAKRDLIHWFVPEVGVVNMYVNPQSIGYGSKKLINAERTKGGYVVQYWGEELETLSIRGNTGSSGIEGINVLYEIYRAEQLNFDSIALTMAADNSVSGLNDLVDSALGNIGGFSQDVLNATTGLFGLDPASQNVLPRNVPSLASMALGVEMYYSGMVYRGYFVSFTVDESADRIGLFNYDIGFTVTERRGYRINRMAWQHSAIDGASNNSIGGPPLSIADVQSSGGTTATRAFTGPIGG